jgi:hypothetical protein
MRDSGALTELREPRADRNRRKALLTRAAPIDRAPQFRTFGVGYVLEYTLEFRA